MTTFSFHTSDSGFGARYGSPLKPSQLVTLILSRVHDAPSMSATNTQLRAKIYELNNEPWMNGIMYDILAVDADNSFGDVDSQAHKFGYRHPSRNSR